MNKEVIVCGGAINSPQLLMLSGIGPADELQALGIAAVVDLPGVGRNLQDHLAVGVVYQCTQPVTMARVETLKNLLHYFLFRQGPLTSNVGEAGGFVKTRSELPTPNVQLVLAPTYVLDHGLARPEGHWFTLVAALLRPRSQGHITLHSSDPFEPPVIQPHYLASEVDLQVLVESTKLLRGLGQTKAFASFRGAELYPGSQAQSPEALGAHVRKTAETLWHPVGTCKMGHDPLAVVDAQLRVHGVEGLRVVDASIMPTIVGGNTNAPTIMIAEKAADLIKKSP